MKFNLSIKHLSYLIVFIVLIAAVAGYSYYKSKPKEITRYDFYGTDLQFRGDLRAAENVSVYPDSQTILNKVWNPNITKINITYVLTPEPSEDNSLIALNAFEIRYKLDVAYNNPRFNWMNSFASADLKSLDDVVQFNDTLSIVLVSPSFTNETVVEVDGNVVYIKGNTPENFDRAVIRFIMSALDIAV